MRFQTALGIAVVVVIPLSVIQWRFPLPLLFYVLLPGNVISLVIAGGHGGTISQDTSARFAAVLLNIVVYSALFLGGAWVRDWMAAK